jgi:hypothetical protein
MRLAWAGSCQTPDFANFLQPIAGDGDAAVDRGIESEVVAAALARGERANPIQIDNEFPVATHKRRGMGTFSTFKLSS